MSVVKIMNMNETRQNHDDPIGLRKLPPVTTEIDGWPEIENTLLARNRRSRRWR